MQASKLNQVETGIERGDKRMLTPPLDTEAPPRMLLGPLTFLWIQKHHQRAVVNSS